MKAILVLLILGLLASGSVFAESCVSSADCDEDSYCGVDNQCHPYYDNSSTNVSCCCGPSLIILAVTGLVLANRK